MVFNRFQRIFDDILLYGALSALAVYAVVQLLSPNEDDIDTTESDAIFSVANRIQKLYDGNTQVGLRIPDAETSSHQNIDVVLATKGKALVISVKNFSGLASVLSDGSWVCRINNRNERAHRPNPLMEANRNVDVLDSYVKQRGLTLPKGYLCSRVILPNPSLCTLGSKYLPLEVIPYEIWGKIQPERRSLSVGWIKDFFCTKEEKILKLIDKKFHQILCTAPMWDRLELKSNKLLLGEFLEFRVNQDDSLALKNIKRSKVGHLLVKGSIWFDIGVSSQLKLLYSPRNYREGTSESEWNEVSVESTVVARFRPYNSSKVYNFKLSSIGSITLGV